MPHSPYRQTFHQPHADGDVDLYKQDLFQHRIGEEQGERDKERSQELLDIGDALVEQCEFLDTKLRIKKNEITQLVKQKETLEAEKKRLEEKGLAQESEIATLKGELERAKAAATAGSEKQLSSRLDGSELVENVDESADTVGVVNPRKRDLEVDSTTDDNAVKKGKKEGEEEEEEEEEANEA